MLESEAEEDLDPLLFFVETDAMACGVMRGRGDFVGGLVETVLQQN